MGVSEKIALAVGLVALIQAGIALWYTIITARIHKANQAAVEAMRLQAETYSRPYIEISVKGRMETQILYLTVRNTGRTPARNLRLTMDRDFYRFAEKAPDRNLRSYAAFSERIDSFPPNTEVAFALADGPALFEATEELVPTRFVVCASYEFGGKTVDETTEIDLRPFRNTSVPHHPVVEELERLRKSIDKLANK